MRRARRRALAGLAALLAGCTTPGSVPPVKYFVMSDLAPAQPLAVTPLPQVLAVAGGNEDAFYDGDSLVFSREAGQRGLYQFAAWTDRPSRRLATLAERRLETRGRFAAVSGATAGVNADLVLNLNLVALYHDLTVKPAVARVEAIAELVDWRSRSLLGRRGFAIAVPVAAENAPGAVAAMNRGITSILDALVPWVEDSAAARR